MIADNKRAIEEALGDFWRLMKQAGEYPRRQCARVLTTHRRICCGYSKEAADPPSPDSLTLRSRSLLYLSHLYPFVNCENFIVCCCNNYMNGGTLVREVRVAGER